MNDNMDHMNYLEDVAAADVAQIRLKEETYKGSWKRRGGVGAFMMLARKWDRLEGMMQSSQHSFMEGPYDIFGHVAMNPDGKDGSALAEIRDLRTYLMLVEAEMVARGVLSLHEMEIRSTLARGDQIEADFYLLKAQEWGCERSEAKERVLRLLSQPLVSYTSDPHVLFEAERPGTPADGGHHEGVGSSRADTDARMEDGLTWQRVHDGDAPWNVLLATPSRSSHDCLYNVERRAYPRDQWEHLPLLTLELNDKEHRDALPEYRDMYEWHDGPGKWILREEFHACWGKQP